MGPFSVRRLSGSDTSNATSFHVANGSEFMVRRDEHFFQTMIDDRSLFGLIENRVIVGLCYVHPDDSEPERNELGGICLAAQAMGLGLGDALSKASLAMYAAEHADAGLFARVHTANLRPRSMLRRVGFHHRNGDFCEVCPCPPGLTPTGSHPETNEPLVVGDIFRFQPPRFGEIAEWLRTAPSSCAGSKGNADLDLRKFFHNDFEAFAIAITSLVP